MMMMVRMVMVMVKRLTRRSRCCGHIYGENDDDDGEETYREEQV